MTLPSNLPAVARAALPHEALDPAKMGFPAMLPVELALGESSPKEICEDYGLSKVEFQALCANPAFQKAHADAVVMLQKEGMSFRVKAKMQSEQLLKTSWALIHSVNTPSNVKADLIKNTMRVAGLEPKESDRAPVMPLQININL